MAINELAEGNQARLAVTDATKMGRSALANPDWHARLARGDAFERFDPGSIHPSAKLEYADWWLMHQNGTSAQSRFGFVNSTVEHSRQAGGLK
jgi:hypothetical protein